MHTLDGMEVLITAAVGDRYLDEIVEGYSTARIFNSTVSLLSHGTNTILFVDINFCLSLFNTSNLVHPVQVIGYTCSYPYLISQTSKSNTKSYSPQPEGVAEFVKTII